MTLMDYKDIGDELTTDELNGIVSLLCHNKVLSEDIRVNNGLVVGEYGKYTFDLQSTTIVDNGVLITNETLTNLGTVTLSEPVLNSATYTLFLTVYTIEDANIIDTNDNSQITVSTLEVELEKDTPVNIPFDTLDYYCVVGFDASLHIKYDNPVILGAYVTGLNITASVNPVQKDGTTVIKIKATDLDNLPVANKEIKLYELVEPSVNVSANPSIIQAGETSTVKIILKDADGSRIQNQEVKLYQIVEE